jgi:Ca-activated chloride channel family protein
MKLFTTLRTISFFTSFFIFVTAAISQTPTPTPPIPEEEDTIVRVESRLVVVPVSVTDAAGEPVLGLKVEDFRLSEENRPQTIDSVGNAENVPLEIALLFDVSASTGPMFKFQQETAAKFLKEDLRSEDRATIFSVGIQPVLIQARDTAERSQAGILSIAPTKEQTAFYDSVRAAADYLAKNSPQGRRKVLVVISDGEDTNSSGVLKAIWDAERRIADNNTKTPGAEKETIDNMPREKLRDLRVKARDTAKAREQVRVLKSLQDADAVLYSINPGGTSIQLNQMALFGQENLQKFADETGGTAFLPKFLPIDTKDPLMNAGNTRRNTALLETIFRQLANELRAQYLIQYYSESDFPTNRFVKLSVDLQNPTGRRVRARQGYYVKN